MKMYILLKEGMKQGFVPLMAAHAAVACYKKFEDDPDMQEWVTNSFKKVICVVNQNEFERAKQFENCVVLTESSADDEELVIAFKPRQEMPKAFRFYRLYK